MKPEYSNVVFHRSPFLFSLLKPNPMIKTLLFCIVLGTENFCYFNLTAWKKERKCTIIICYWCITDMKTLENIKYWSHSQSFRLMWLKQGLVFVISLNISEMLGIKVYINSSDYSLASTHNICSPSGASYSFDENESKSLIPTFCSTLTKDYFKSNLLIRSNKKYLLGL